MLTYGESGDNASTHFSDQTHLFAQKQLRAMLYRETDIAADPQLAEQSVHGPRL